MNHPSREEWMSLLYGETTSAEQNQLESHLKQCVECRAQVSAWRSTASQLNDWPVATQRTSLVSTARYLKWGMAAVLILGLGFALARATAPKPDLSALRAELKQELRGDLEKIAADKSAENRRALDNFVAAYRTGREEDRTAIVAILKQMEEQRVSNYASLRKDLETVAVTAENKLDLTQRQIGQLVTYTRPVDNAAKQ